MNFIFCEEQKIYNLSSQILLLKDRFLSLRGLSPINFSFLTTAKLPNGRSYFPHSLEEDFKNLGGLGFRYIPYKSSSELQNVHLLIVTVHGEEVSELIMELRTNLPHLILAIWFFDNHLAYLPNYKTAVMGDIYYPSHAYCKNYLLNPFSPMGLNLPACTAQWAANQFDFKKILVNSYRASKIFLNYVDYKFSWRSQLIGRIQKAIPSAHTELMFPENRDRYFSLSTVQKYQEWCAYKSTLILPVDRDLSTRVFDALLAGQILIVPTMIEDFDGVISRDWQNKLGIIRITDLDISTIKTAANKAFEIFDKRGVDGLIERFDYISKNHMLKNRIEAILKNIQSISNEESHILYGLLDGGKGLFIK